MHHDDHGHGCDHHHAPTNYGLVFLTCMVLNGGYGLLQLYVSWREAHSLALFTDALHNLSDVFSIALPWVAIMLAAKAPTAGWTFGGKRATITAAVVNYTALLFFMVWAIVEAVRRIDSPRVVSGEIMTVMGLIGIVINLSSAWLLRRGGKHDLNIRAAYLHQAGDLVSSIAVVIAGIITIRTGWGVIDPIVTILVSCLIIYMMWGGFCESWRLLNGGTPKGIDGQKIIDYLESMTGVMNTHSLWFFSVSTTETTMGIHIVAAEGADLNQIEIRKDLEESFGINPIGLRVENIHDDCSERAFLYGGSAVGVSHQAHIGHVH